MTEIPVLDKGFVRLDAAMADDLSVVNSARVSFAKRSESMDDSGAALIGFLMKGRHGTPFEHNAMRFHVKAPIFVVREWQRHRIGSFNEWSGRYSKLEPEFYVPQLEDVRSQVGKPGSYTFEPLDWRAAVLFSNSLSTVSHEAFKLYEEALAIGVAKEQARLFLPLNIYTQMYWTINARSLMNFLSLRNNEHAMFEIREYAKVIEDVWAELMPVTHATFIENERVAP